MTPSGGTSTTTTGSASRSATRCSRTSRVVSSRAAPPRSAGTAGGALPSGHGALQDGNLYVGGRLRRAVDTLRCRLEVAVLRLEDVGHERLRVAIDEREPAALHLDGDAVPAPEAIVLGMQ